MITRVPEDRAKRRSGAEKAEQDIQRHRSKSKEGSLFSSATRASPDRLRQLERERGEKYRASRQQTPAIASDEIDRPIFDSQYTRRGTERKQVHRARRSTEELGELNRTSDEARGLKKISLQILPALAEDFKQECSRRGITLTQGLTAALRAWLKQ